jgi:hypothetical protein
MVEENAWSVFFKEIRSALSMYNLKRFWTPLIAGIFIDLVCLFSFKPLLWGCSGIFTGLIVGALTGTLVRGIGLTFTTLFIGHLAFFKYYYSIHPYVDYGDTMTPTPGMMFFFMLFGSLATAMLGIILSVCETRFIQNAIHDSRVHTPFRNILTPFIYLNNELPDEILQIYSKKYPHNPTGVLRYHIDRKMKEGKTREQVIEELVEESG